ncbi:hypothetical protein FOZ63_023003 [Perkinsus olseni]|uniref:Uncharacterized protein n=1 Tax=Perkinsus olseni TaxID=32597 RepID=A0A7J6NDV4_PEROL|nr:hypothetical protein FOZ63_023003 [Perkinsus olseni]KAF4718318.1 hypothetical protein FOZ62_029786 [Perkinsus olseni]
MAFIIDKDGYVVLSFEVPEQSPFVSARYPLSGGPDDYASPSEGVLSWYDGILGISPTADIQTDDLAILTRRNFAAFTAYFQGQELIFWRIGYELVPGVYRYYNSTTSREITYNVHSVNRTDIHFECGEGHSARGTFELVPLNPLAPDEGYEVGSAAKLTEFRRSVGNVCPVDSKEEDFNFQFAVFAAQDAMYVILEGDYLLLMNEEKPSPPGRELGCSGHGPYLL